jgi:hypothetical protein
MSTAQLIEQRKSRVNDAKATARARYADLLQRAGNPHSSDVQALDDVMATLGLSDVDLAADVIAIEKHEKLGAERLTAEQREKVEKDGAARIAAVIERKRAFLAGMIQDIDPHWMKDAFNTLNGALIHSNRGSHIERAAVWEALNKDQHTTKLDTLNRLTADDRAAAEMARLEAEHPLAFGHSPREIAPPPEPQVRGPVLQVRGPVLVGSVRTSQQGG